MLGPSLGFRGPNATSVALGAHKYFSIYSRDTLRNVHMWIFKKNLVQNSSSQVGKMTMLYPAI